MKINAFTKYIFIIAFTCFLLPILLFGQQGDSIYVMPGSKVVIGDSTINATLSAIMRYM